jgi:uncharacterized protein YraI
MRALTIVFLVSMPAWAAPRTAVIQSEVAEVRSGASEKFYVTNRLPRGSQVEILEEMPGNWLKIKPPVGSFSWVSTTLLDRTRPDGRIYVYADLKGLTVPVYIGSDIVKDRRPDVAGVRLKHGELVVALAEPMQDKDGWWLPIEPPASEVRYLHRSAVEPQTNTTFTPVSATTPAKAEPKGPLPDPKYPSANPTRTPEEEWQEAALAEYHGKHEEAIRLYDALAKRTQTSHPHIAGGATQRANRLREIVRGPVPVAPTPTLPPATSQRPSAPSTPTANSSPANRPAGERLPGTYRARLARAGWAIDRKPTYRIDVYQDGTFKEAGYAISGNPAINLELWVGREIEVGGNLWYHGMARRNVLTVTSIRESN